MRLIGTSDAAAGTLGSEYGTTDEAYHISARNPSFTKDCYKAHETHYSPWVQQLVADAPLHREDLPQVPLPPPSVERLQMSVGEALVRRRSGRAYGNEPLHAIDLSTILCMALGVHRMRGSAQEPTTLRRSVTNSGNLGSVEAYPVILDVEGVPAGVYHFDSVQHDLRLLRAGCFRDWLRQLVLYQLEFADAAVALVLTTAFGRLKAKYGPRGYRLGWLDVGHVSENVYLIATSLGLAVCATAGFVDEELELALGLDGLETAASLVLLLGRPPR
jgi:SagB-type dehydrogenase family enzyme